MYNSFGQNRLITVINVRNNFLVLSILRRMYLFQTGKVGELIESTERKYPYKFDLCEKSFSASLVWLCIRKFIQKQNHTNVLCEKSFCALVWLCIRKFFRNKTIKCDLCEKSFSTWLVWLCIIQFIHKQNHINVTCVKSHFMQS